MIFKPLNLFHFVLSEEKFFAVDDKATRFCTDNHIVFGAEIPNIFYESNYLSDKNIGLIGFTFKISSLLGGFDINVTYTGDEYIIENMNEEERNSLVNCIYPQLSHSNKYYNDALSYHESILNDNIKQHYKRFKINNLIAKELTKIAYLKKSGQEKRNYVALIDDFNIYELNLTKNDNIGLDDLNIVLNQLSNETVNRIEYLLIKNNGIETIYVNQREVIK